jgi:signal transduction histidine kinase
MRLDAMNVTPPTPEEISESANLAEECVKQVRTLSYLLYPPMLEEMGLTSAVPWYLEGFSKRSGIQTTFHAPHDFGRLSRDAELVLFRVLQESLTNVQRHSGSKTAEINIFYANDVVALQVIDKGRGMPTSILEEGNQDWTASLGVGLRGMSERLRSLGGMLQVSSSERGTEVRATVPIQDILATTETMQS